MPALALTPGCPSGIGPELFPLALHRARIDPSLVFYWCSSAAHFARHADAHKIAYSSLGSTLRLPSALGDLQIHCLLEDHADLALKARPGKPDHLALKAQRDALLMAIDLAKQNRVQGIVTGPVRKAALQNIDGKSYGGQTELFHAYLAQDSRPPLMVFAGYRFALGLATIHVAIKDVSALITADLIRDQVERLHEAVTRLFGLEPAKVRLAVLGLNPHAGEQGLIGNEEVNILSPELDRLRQKGLHIQGPLPADGFFGSLYRQSPEQLPHAVLAMMHDQGLSPYKLLCQGKVANLTFGLTLPRTSPAHGTADDIAGRYVASPDSLIEAIELAQRLCSESS